ncbi:hypothetical protein CAAN1_18S01838 [[Candida] anglica]|uniref:DUF202 domain-containing protein n=1 Tax=[Candida] anglica TaxID=148631 RepID=A0ABP0EMA4_9ASCO
MATTPIINNMLLEEDDPIQGRTPERIEEVPQSYTQYAGEELTSLLSHLHPHIEMKVSSSEPRDALQSERTCLTFIRFATTLFFTALGITFNFRFQTSDVKDSKENKRTKFSTVVSMILIALSLSVLLVSAINYFKTINRYAAHKIQNYGFNNLTSVVCVTAVIITLMGINISLIIEGYLEES